MGFAPARLSGWGRGTHLAAGAGDDEARRDAAERLRGRGEAGVGAATRREGRRGVGTRDAGSAFRRMMLLKKSLRHDGRGAQREGGENHPGRLDVGVGRALGVTESAREASRRRGRN